MTKKEMTNKEKVEILIKYFVNEWGNISLSDIDFGNKSIYFNNIKAYKIDNHGQEAELCINNNEQKAELYITNSGQETKEYIHNIRQIAKHINNSKQISKNKINNSEQILVNKTIKYQLELIKLDRRRKELEKLINIKGEKNVR